VSGVFPMTHLKHVSHLVRSRVQRTRRMSPYSKYRYLVLPRGGRGVRQGLRSHTLGVSCCKNGEATSTEVSGWWVSKRFSGEEGLGDTSCAPSPLQPSKTIKNRSKEVVDVRNAIHNPINYPINNPIRNAAKKRKRTEEVKDMLAAKGLAGHIPSLTRRWRCWWTKSSASRCRSSTTTASLT
jgi:hypothetical protein